MVESPPTLNPMTLFYRPKTLLAILLALFSSSLTTMAQNSGGRYIAVLADQAQDPRPSANAIARQHAVQVGAVYRHALRGFSFAGNDQSARAITQRADVSYVVPDSMCHAIAQTTPTGINRADVEVALNIDGLNNDLTTMVRVAVLDTGLDADHPDLNVVGGIRYYVKGLGAVQSDSKFDDDHGHGTHVGGTIGAIDNNIGVVGVAPGVELYAVKVLDRRGSGATSAIIAGIDYVVGLNMDADAANDIHVANMSLGGNYNQALNDAVEAAVAEGIVFVVAAGNESTNASLKSPASAATAITVSALADSDGQPGGAGGASSYGADDTFASFSNYGGSIDIMAPGVDILSTYRGGGYATSSGTSMASPHVAGAAALYIANHDGDPYGGKTGTEAVNAICTALRAAAWTMADPEYLVSGNTRDSTPEPLLNVGALFGPVATPPTVTILSPVGTIFTTGTLITFKGSAEDQPDGTISSNLVWTSNLDGFIGNGESFDTTTLRIGTHAITASVTDSDNATSTDTITITIQSSSGSVSVQPIVYSTTGGRGGDKHLQFRVFLLDGFGEATARASVSIRIAHDSGSAATATSTTDSTGSALFEWKNAPTGTFTTTVTDVSAGALIWDGFTPASSYTK